MVTVTWIRPPDSGDARGNGQHAHDLTPPDPLLQLVVADCKQEDEARRERRLNDRERREDKGKCLHRPAEEPEGGSREPERPPDEPPQQRDSQRVLVRHAPGLECLQPDCCAVECGGGERRGQSDQEAGHGSTPR